ncbi:flavodoxin [Rhizobium laguerreae]|uniref:flavodoxin n=1 Tax=Rhizobium laguerreae TaxID=1076926 RepID=UPI001FECDD70|nr:flavodoxin [Rhizobium laguerreae]MBY3416330.1 flavodoxin [Rhizobium laguerreae]
MSLAAAGTVVARQTVLAAPAADPAVLVAYYSRTGNTRVLADQIRRGRSGSLFEIKLATPYPEDYFTTVAQAAAETKSGFLPRLLQVVADIQSYDTIFLGFPIWGMTAPPVIRAFLAAHDFSGKKVVPFITHGGYGVGDSLSVLRTHAPNADFQPEFVMEADQERRTLEAVSTWLDTGPSTD